ncbi:MAG TPA: hypothetical protein VIJ16_10225 [Gemmatimonadaceae bacterium]
MAHQDRHIDFKKNQGWGAAVLTILLVIALIATAAYIHNTTYKSPNDLTMRARGERTN